MELTASLLLHLLSWQVQIVEPVSKLLACGDEGNGGCVQSVCGLCAVCVKFVQSVQCTNVQCDRRVLGLFLLIVSMCYSQERWRMLAR
jgi:hypothetical protein